jgi:hypothetical protein
MPIHITPVFTSIASACAVFVVLIIFVASTTPFGLITPAELPVLIWRFWSGSSVPSPKMSMTRKYNISDLELKKILDPEPGIPVEDYVLVGVDGDSESTNATLYERASQVAEKALSQKDSEPWLLWAQPRFADGGMHYLNVCGLASQKRGPGMKKGMRIGKPEPERDLIQK